MLSTLHTNDAAGAVVRLIDSGVEPFLVGSSLIMAQAQRLYRKLCPFCKREAKLPLEILKANDIDPAVFDGAKVFSPGGCPKCGNSGFKGRGAIMEVLPVDEEVRAAILKGEGSDRIRQRAIERGQLPACGKCRSSPTGSC